MWRLPSFAVVLSLAVATASACGGASAATDANAKDAAPDGVTGPPQDAAQERPPVDVPDVTLTPYRCAGATYIAAPSGAACTQDHFERAGSFSGACYGPPVGSFCDRLQVSLRTSDVASLPPGFVCGSPELGVTTCLWSFGDDASSGHALDDAALEAACAVTIALPAVKVLCATHGS